MAVVHGPNDALVMLCVATVLATVATARLATSAWSWIWAVLDLAAIVTAATLVWLPLHKARRRQALRRHAAATKHSVAIVGAGFGGLLMAKRLKEAGVDFVVFEKAPTGGGVWTFNRYPGAGCDVPSQLYSYSEYANALWTRVWPKQKEIKQYIDDFIADHDLAPHIRYSHEVVQQVWDPRMCEWSVQVRPVAVSQSGMVLSVEGAPFVVKANTILNATGQLSRPRIPDLPGRQLFRGTAVHSAEWPKDLDLTNRRVCVIGTGPTSVQLVPAAAKTCSQLYVVQRSTAWHVDKHDHPYSKFMLSMFKHVPFARQLSRLTTFLMAELVFVVGYQFRWGNAMVSKLSAAMIKNQLGPDGAHLLGALIPNEPMACKRILISSNYLPTLCQSHVELVQGTAASVTANGLVVSTKDGGTRELEADVIVYCTGFHAQDWCTNINIRGLGGAKLTDVWKEEPYAYYGMEVDQMPNFHMLYGPYSNLGHNSILYMLECQVNYVVELLTRQLEGGHKAVCIKPEVCKRFVATSQKKLAGTAFTWGCTSWYTAKNNRVVNNWTGTCLEFFLKTFWPNLSNYDLLDAE